MATSTLARPTHSPLPRIVTRTVSRGIPQPTATVLPDAPDRAVSCPGCGQPAAVEWRDMLAGTSGPVVHVKLRCSLGRHWFLMPEEGL